MDHPDKFFKEGTVESSEFPTDEEGVLKFGFNASALIVAIDSGGPLEYSFNGKDLHGVLYVKDKFIAMDQTGAGKITFRSRGGVATKFRVWAWVAKG